MAETTNINWCDSTFNAWIGCARISAGCERCYAESDQDNFRGRVKWGIHGTRSVTSYTYWRQALKWNRDAEKEGKRRSVFCSSLSDVFEKWDGQVIDHKQNPLWWSEYGNYFDADDIPTFSHHTEKKDGDVPLTLNIIRKELCKLIERTPWLDWLFLTKRTDLVMGMVPEHWKEKFPDNVWMGTTLEQQKEDWRIDYLKKIPARIRFLSCEPLVSVVDLKLKGITGISWVICGGESGSGARPMHINWARTLRDQCKEANIPFLFKQWGEWISCDKTIELHSAPKNKCGFWDFGVFNEGGHSNAIVDSSNMVRVGKHNAGRLLDGKEHNEFPK